MDTVFFYLSAFLSVSLILEHHKKKNSKWNTIRLCYAASTDIQTISKQYIPPTQPGNSTLIIAILGGDGGSGLKNKSRTIIKNVPVSCNGGCLCTVDWIQFDNQEEKKLLLKKEQTHMHCLNIFLLYVLEHLLAIHSGCAIKRCFDAVLSNGGNRMNIDQNDHFGLETKYNAASLQTLDSWEIKSKLFYLGTDFLSILGLILLSSQLLFMKDIYYLNLRFKNL